MNSSPSEQMRDLADDLEALSRGTLAAEQFRLKYASAGSNSVAGELWGNLDHYLDDADIRERDAEYREMQQCEMSKLVRLLRQGAPLAQLRQVSFLGSTPE